jgi:3-hydroxyacyl-CoA dehydrogenase
MAGQTRVACIGAGLVGRAWAIVFARAGHLVRVFDEAPGAAEAACDFAAEVLPELAREGLLDGAAPDDVLGRIAVAHSLEQAMEGAVHVQESTPERLDVKRRVFARLDALAGPEATIGSSSSAILPSAFTEGLGGRHRCLVVHPINPPYLVPAVEVVPAPWTDPEARDRVAELLRHAGMAPIVMRKELDGFVMNRLQGALLEEAFRLVADGHASIEDVDIGIREGLALRWSFMGPFETIDLNAPGGVRDYAERYQHIYERLFPSMQRRVDWAGPVMDELEAGRRRRLPAQGLAERQLWRDRRLMALAAHKRRAAREIGE